MPEGDTVHQAARRLDAGLSGQRLVSADLRVPSLALADLSDVEVLRTVSRGKHLLTRFGNGLTLHSHLVMEGLWAVLPATGRWPAQAHRVRAVLRTATTQAVGAEVRLDLGPTSEEATWVGHLGPDLLGDDWDPAEAIRRLSERPDRPVAEALLDQRNLAGVGNVYANEICFLSGTDPRSPVSALTEPARVVRLAHRLLRANADRTARVTTGIDRPGRRLWVYGRRGPCLRCGAAVRRTDLGPPGRERVTYWCPRCQPPESG